MYKGRQLTSNLFNNWCLTLVAKTPAVAATPPSRTSLSQFLHDKTGVTGAWVLGVGLTSVAISKELYVFNHVVCMYDYVCICTYVCMYVQIYATPPVVW